MKIEFFTDNELALKHYPPVPASTILPGWYEDMDMLMKNSELSAKHFIASGNSSVFTIKSCIPAKDYITSGYIIRTFADVLITPEENLDGTQSWWWKSSALSATSGSPEDKLIGQHPYGQCPIEINNTKHVYIKYNNSWVVKTPPGYSCLFYQPEYFFNKNIKFFPGIVDTDRFDLPVNFPGIILAKETFTLKAGSPLMVVFPFKRDEWVSEVSLKNIPFKTSIYRTKLFRAYLKLFHSKKSYK